MRRLLALFLLLVLAFSSISAQETDYWQQQRDYYLQYSAWELPTEAIIATLNELEKSEKLLNEAQNELRIAKNELTQLKVESERLQKSLEVQRGLLVSAGVIAVGITLYTVLTN